MVLQAAGAEPCQGRAPGWVLAAPCRAIQGKQGHRALRREVCGDHLKAEVPGGSRDRAIGGAQVGQVAGGLIAPHRALSLAVINLLIQPKSLTVLWAPPGTPLPAGGPPPGALGMAAGTGNRPAAEGGGGQGRQHRKPLPVPSCAGPRVPAQPWANI